MPPGSEAMTERNQIATEGTATIPKRETFIERMIEASASNKFLVFIFTIFAVAAGLYGLMQTPLDAIPDLSDVQVIVYTDWEGRSPDLVEDQITYPISTEFIAAPKVKFVRGESMFGKSFVYVIFRGRHRYLLGAFARHRISQLGARLAAGRRQSSHRSGRDRRRLGLRIRAG